ncbi:GNAT family N-acetyltransferase [Halorussus sp. AFM4]|uniref:GNAT family N-acetyltransferase n=1 Tax=Halorussus sp. AFM4 TaxID=3421651 RepID=UPI003EC116A4
MFPETFETDRLRFERLRRDAVDAREFYEVSSRRNSTIAEETRYLPWNPTATVKEAADRLEEFERQWADRERAEWIVRPKEGEDGAGEIAGTAGLLCRWEKDLGVPAIWLRKPFWGRGYSGERADALLEIAFDRLDFGVVAVPLHADNEKSYRAVEKYVERHGGRYEGLLRNHAGRYDDPADHHRFSISREEYESSD